MAIFLRVMGLRCVSKRAWVDVCAPARSTQGRVQCVHASSYTQNNRAHIRNTTRAAKDEQRDALLSLSPSPAGVMSASPRRGGRMVTRAAAAKEALIHHRIPNEERDTEEGMERLG